MLVGSLALAVLLVLAGLGFHFLGGREQHTGPPPTLDAPLRDLTQLEDAQTSRLRELRDEALECMGWAAGNSFRQPNWPEIESIVGQRGLYFDPMITLAPPGLAEGLKQAEKNANLARYEQAFVRGNRAEFDAGETERCVERTKQISDEIARILGSVRETPTIDDPLSIGDAASRGVED